MNCEFHRAEKAEACQECEIDAFIDFFREGKNVDMNADIIKIACDMAYNVPEDRRAA